jgi:hypothetical protein
VYSFANNSSVKPSPNFGFLISRNNTRCATYESHLFSRGGCDMKRRMAEVDVAMFLEAL